jgi:hypothetical protein
VTSGNVPETVHEFTPDQIVQGINCAITDREFAVIPSLIKLLAVQDPHLAQGVLDNIEMGQIVARAGHR